MSRKPVTKASIRRSQRNRQKEAKRLTEYARPMQAALRADEVKKVCRQVRDVLVGQLDMSDGEVAEFYGWSERSLYRYKARYPELAQAMVRGEQKVVQLVERKLVQTAVGFRTRRMKIMQHEGEPFGVHYEEEITPNVAAQVAFLKAKKPAEYRDRVEHSGDPASPVRFILDGRDLTETDTQPEKEDVNAGAKTA